MKLYYSAQRNLRYKYFKLFYKKRINRGGRSLISGRVINRNIRQYKHINHYNILKHTCAPKFSPLLNKKAYLYLGNKFYNYKAKSSSFVRFQFGIIVNTPSILSICRYSSQSPLWYKRTVTNWSYNVKNYNHIPLNKIPPATRVKFIAGSNSKNIIAHAVGSYATLVIVFNLIRSAVILAPSGKLLLVSCGTMAALFSFNDDCWINKNRLGLLEKQNRKGVRKMLFRCRRPTVRGTVKNPCDHPHGGRTRGILRPRTPWNKSVLKSKVYVGAPLTLRNLLRTQKY